VNVLDELTREAERLGLYEMRREVYFSLDVETDGPSPGEFSMLSLGCVAFDWGGNELSSFTDNLTRLHMHGDPDTMAWWRTQPDAWEAATKDPELPSIVMSNFVEWVERTSNLGPGSSGKPVALAYPAGFDWTFVYWYLRKFAGRSPFGFQCLDLKSFAAAKLGTPFRNTSKKTMPREWFKGLPAHTHKAVDDAREQGLLFFRMRDHEPYDQN
jgi:hypothetical protein